MMNRKCILCGEDFSPYTKRQKVCSKKQCQEIRIRNSSRIYYFKNIEKTRIRHNHNSKIYYSKNKKKIKERNKLRRKEWDRKYRKKNQEIIKKNGKKYLKTEKGKINMFKYNNKRRAIKNNIIEKFTPKEWKIKLLLTKGICPLCKINVGINKLTLDHIYPKIKANEDFKTSGIKKVYTIKDIQPLCRSCNSKKRENLK